MPSEHCFRCEGCGKIANSTDGEAWTHWEGLPESAKLAIRLGIVYPVPCPACDGTGVRIVKAKEVDNG